MAWIFYDTNVFGDSNAEYDISGEDYAKLLNICLKYCDTLMLRVLRNDAKNIDHLEKYRINKPFNIDEKILMSVYYCDGYYLQEQFRFYRLCPELLRLMLETSNSVFGWSYDWQHAPEDPVFFRADGSVFFDSVVHDGELRLFPRSTENVEEIVENNFWYEVSEIGAIKLKHDESKEIIKIFLSTFSNGIQNNCFLLDSVQELCEEDCNSLLKNKHGVYLLYVTPIKTNRSELRIDNDIWAISKWREKEHYFAFEKQVCVFDYSYSWCLMYAYDEFRKCISRYMIWPR